MSEEKLVPKLRFPDFEHDWESKKLKDLSNIQRGASPRPITAKKWYDNENKKVGWVRIGDVTSSSKYLTKTEDYFSEEGVKKSRFLPKGSLIMSICATIGKPIVTGMDTCIHDGFVGFSELKNINKEFLYYYLNILEPKFISLSQTGSQANLNSDLVRNAEIGVPSIQEQEKIVNFISAVDKKHNILNKNLETQLSFKKYLMQQIFTQKLRFNFTDEWEKYLLGDISLIGKGFTPSTSNPSFWDGDLKWLSIADMNQGKYINQTTKKITSDGSKNKEPVKKGTLLMSFKLSIGKLGILTEDMYTNEAICNFKWKNKDVLTEYMYYYLSSINILKYGSQAAKGITLNNETLSTIPVLLPSLEEQKKIINILSDVDMKINMLENSINDTSKFKKGLLQQMFI
jgi:type I restriction enzyme S subunit